MEQPNYTKQLLLQLNQQRSRGYLCDVIIVVENALFRAHKNILAACSGYFNPLLLRDNMITLDTQRVKPQVFRQVLDFIYTGQLPSSHHVSDKDMSALLRAASYLQLYDLEALCRRKLKPCRPSNPPSSIISSLTPNGQPQVDHSYKSGPTEDGKSHKLVQVELEGTMTPEMNDRVETRLGPSASSLQQSPSNSSSNNASPNDNPEQSHPTDSHQMAAQRRPRSHRDSCLGGSVGTKRQEVESAELIQAEWRVSTELEGRAEFRQEHWALKNKVERSEGKELNGNKQASYIYHQPQPGFALQGSLYMCIPCGKGFPSSEQLIAHVESHAAEELVEAAEERSLIKVDVEDPDMRPASHVCSVCSRSYMDAALLRQHERSHRLSRPVSCDVCGKQFTQRGTMTRHRRSHLALKPFACDECGMRFTRQYRKMEHMRIHTREKPYQLCVTADNHFLLLTVFNEVIETCEINRMND
ncbi:LOW QUALITY PROTEIN: hypermethylated in cancer 2 protein-like [Scomber scombrus]|uniref:LOW QUALITY PROTEIN: hypermethylated in cancer 2 protein-like n=1 Tax=Scomber scombrus TaxID=13677 RepID=A0AAV1NA58_SCOSC